MKLIILKDNIKKGLEIVERVTGKNLTLPILNNILISTEKNLLKISGTDLEIGIKYWSLCKTEKEGEIVVPAKFMTTFINSLLEEKINLEVKNKILYIEGENYKAKIKTESGQEFPIIPKIETENFITLDSNLFTQGLSQVVEFTTSNQATPERSGVYFNFQKNKLNLVATDGFRLAEKIIPLKKEINNEYSFILPQKTTHTLINIFSEKQEEIKIYMSPNQVQFETFFPEIPHPEKQVISRLIDGDYPNYKEIMPKNYETEVIVSKDKFLNQIKTASLFSGKVNQIKIKVDPKEQKIEAFSQSSELGENRSYLDGKITGKEMSVSFNWKYLLDGLSHIKSSEVIIGLSKERGPDKEKGPAVIKPKGDESYLYIVMPISDILDAEDPSNSSPRGSNINIKEVED